MLPGLYTSPHLVAVRERIRIDGDPLSEETFTKYFYETWNRLQENKTVRLIPFPRSFNWPHLTRRDG
jgi:folylpolyglutamate synthase/dihydropteroate synthase